MCTLVIGFGHGRMEPSDRCAPRHGFSGGVATDVDRGTIDMIGMIFIIAMMRLIRTVGMVDIVGMIGAGSVRIAIPKDGCRDRGAPEMYKGPQRRSSIA